MKVLKLTQSQRNRLVRNHQRSQEAIERDGNTPDHEPVVKIFNPCGGATWLLTELDPETDIAFGLCDLGMGSPELGYVSMAEMREVRNRLGLPLEIDRWFSPSKPISVYAEEASRTGRIFA